MRIGRAATAILAALALLVAACSPAATPLTPAGAAVGGVGTPDPSPLTPVSPTRWPVQTPVPTPTPTPPPTRWAGPTNPSALPPTPTPTAALTPSATPVPTPGPTPSPTFAPMPPPGALPAPSTADGTVLAPAANGGLVVAVPSESGAVLALLDASGRPRPGWPLLVERSTRCSFVGVAEDGSVRAVCDATDTYRWPLEGPDWRAFAYDTRGRLKSGWPVQIRPSRTVRVVGDDLVLATGHMISDACVVGMACDSLSAVTVAADGSVDPGVAVPIINEESTFGTWAAIGPDAVVQVLRSFGDLAVPPRSQVTAISARGELPRRQITLAGRSSGLAIGPDGRVIVLLGDLEGTSRVVALDPVIGSVQLSSPALDLATTAVCVDCCIPSADPPMVAANGRVFVAGIGGAPIIALDRSLRVLPGWPYDPSDGVPPLEECVGGGLCCQWPPPTPMAAGPDGTLHLTLQRSSASVGQSIVALDAAARVVPGWPVELWRPDATFGSIVVDDDGTVFALALEPEGAQGMAGTILAIEHDGEIRYRRTVAEP
jgi:hypothetical protein